jgi:ATP-dependent Clp protease ATP-binding subunit ClpC
MFERFTDRARRVVVLAQEEARMLNHDYIGTEHLLLGLIHEGRGVAAKALESLGISLEVVRQQVEEIIGLGQQAPSGHIPFTPRAKKVLELSLRESLQLGQDYIGTEHILLGLLREGDGVAAQVLVKLGADLNRVRQQVIQLVTGRHGEEVTGEANWQGERARAGLPDDAFTRIDALDQEIAQARREKDAAIDRQDFDAVTALHDQEKQLLAARAAGEKSWMQAAAAPSLASEFGRVNAELARLRAILREYFRSPSMSA